MTAERLTHDIANDLRRLSVDDDSIALVVEAADRLEELLADLANAENERDLNRAERNWLLAGLPMADRANFHMLAQTHERAVAELGKEQYFHLINVGVLSKPCPSCKASAGERCQGRPADHSHIQRRTAT